MNNGADAGQAPNAGISERSPEGADERANE